MIGGKHYSFLKDTRHHLSELVQYPFVCLGKDTVTYEFYSNLLLKYDLVFKPDIEVASTNQLMPMIKNDLGIGFIPERFAKEALENGEVFSIHWKNPFPDAASVWWKIQAAALALLQMH